MIGMMNFGVIAVDNIDFNGSSKIIYPDNN